MHILETTPETHERGIQLLDEVLPWLRDSTGFRGMLRLATPDRSKTVVLTFWSDEAAIAESEEAGRAVGGLAAEVSGANRVGLEDYEVTFLDPQLELESG